MRARFIYEAIKHLSPRSVESILKTKQKIISKILPKMQDAYNFISKSPIWEPIDKLQIEETKIFFDFKSKFKMIDFRINRFISKYSYRYYKFIYYLEENRYALAEENLLKNDVLFEQRFSSVTEFKNMFHEDKWGKKLFKRK